MKWTEIFLFKMPTKIRPIRDFHQCMRYRKLSRIYFTWIKVKITYIKREVPNRWSNNFVHLWQLVSYRGTQRPNSEKRENQYISRWWLSRQFQSKILHTQLIDQMKEKKFYWVNNRSHSYEPLDYWVNIYCSTLIFIHYVDKKQIVSRNSAEK